MLTRKTPDTLATELTIKGQSETIAFDVTYYNRAQADIESVLEQHSQNEVEMTKEPRYANLKALMFLVKSMDTEYEVSEQGFLEMESDRPGMIEVLFMGYHKARRVELRKN